MENLCLASCFKISDETFSKAAMAVIESAHEVVAAAAEITASQPFNSPPFPLQKLRTLDISHTSVSSTTMTILGTPQHRPKS
jgi:hypothetical protein